MTPLLVGIPNLIINIKRLYLLLHVTLAKSFISGAVPSLSGAVSDNTGVVITFNGIGTTLGLHIFLVGGSQIVCG